MNIKLYELILKDCDMGVYTLHMLLDRLKDRDNKIKGVIEEILTGYERVAAEIKDIIQSELKPASKIGKMGVKTGIIREVRYDNSDSSMAYMVIQGLAMGCLNMEKYISQFKKSDDKKALKMAKKFLKFQEKSISKLTKYL